MKLVKLNLSILFIVISFSVYGEAYTAVREIAQRRVPWLVSSLSFSVIPTETGEDIFELSSVGNMVNIAASNSNSAAYGLGYYLKYYCNRSMSHLGDNLSPLLNIPKINKKVRISSPFRFRYALNYCTISYSMAYYKWAEWERELDWMALNGVNLMLAPVGMEAVWQNTLKKLGYNNRDIGDFIADPAFSAWWLMGNLEGWGGPITQSVINQQAKLEQQIIKRMRDLKIEPVMQGFYGMVPTSLKNKMKASVIDQGKWAGGFTRPDFLIPTDTAFSQVADIYYTEMKKLYGADLHFFGGDPFHEGGNSKGVDVSTAATIIQRKMDQHFSGSSWVLQGWQSNPSEALLNGLDKKKTLVIELFGENTNNWEKRKGYNGTPFVWSNVSNFGEKNGLYGKLQRFSDEVNRAKGSEYGQYLAGIGIIPEGINNNPVAFDFMLELGWHQNPVSVKSWIKTYQDYRYGKSSSKMDQAWQLLLQTAYSSPEIYQEGPSESIFCARPGVAIKTVSTWGTRKRNYNPELFLEAVKLFVAAGDDYANVETYQTDKIDLVRQVLANKGDKSYQNMIEAIQAKDVVAFKKESAVFQKLILQQDSLLSSSRYFSLNRWLEQAINFAKTPADRERALRNAKIQITYWGPENNPKTDLHDYAHKEWSGLLGSLYLSRWQRFIKEQLAKMEGKESNSPDYFAMEVAWTKSADTYRLKPINVSQLNKLIDNILK
ncbi:alpha-N-acetylglucosaminidase C-terminal domain-containing protein [Pedobacter riviphilus]|uniref:Alpha-N-acetylglucosaminidase C-terminal domain-containing protein n=1 Tax=Pedobacter riviphilus TaxID=2766984 RepID=A0ABX6TI53_9SPHI|nr:alpha-N-acetylglucosaminidase [Pedobacter riviphilus]QNR85148.1 alpha-N-acetylglucosaminidase C-terminal domain-containing protein [Pedobacter riviphilus]